MQSIKSVLYKNNNNVTGMIEKFTISQMIWALNEVTPAGFNFGISGDGTITVECQDTVSKTTINLDLTVSFIGEFSDEIKEQLQSLFIDYYKRYLPEVKIYTLA